jgi:hypothetical protein
VETPVVLKGPPGLFKGFLYSVEFHLKSYHAAFPSFLFGGTGV